MNQLNLIFQTDEDLLKGHLEKFTKKKISLVITDNSTSMLSMRKKGAIVSIRLHRIFLSSGREVLDEIAGFIKNSKTSTPHIRDFINQNSHQLKKRLPRKIIINAAGSCYDLLEMFHLINMEYFEGKVPASITWGSKGPRKAAARRTLGSYCSVNNTIRINPMLDNRGVPRYFVEFIVYHEMLHADMGIERNTARRTVHSKAFKRREKLFKSYDRAIAWEKKRW